MTYISTLSEHLAFQQNLLIPIDLQPYGIEDARFYIYLDYLNHPTLSGNKIRKLYGHLSRPDVQSADTIITVGGNYSNYIYACSFLPELLGKKLVLLIKGSKPKEDGFLLRHLTVKKNIQVEFIPRTNNPESLQRTIQEYLSQISHSAYIPEGGSGDSSKLGFQALIEKNFDDADILAIGVGTSSSYQAINHYKNSRTQLIGYAAVNDYSLHGNIEFDYTFGGFARVNDVLVQFAYEFYQHHRIVLDPIYTSKMLYGIIDRYKKGRFLPSQKIVAIHTGGIQGWHGILERFPIYLEKYWKNLDFLAQ